jgi:Uma2 family endonuclease
MHVETLVSVQEYLSSDYEPDCDYVDGVLEERNLGEQDHSRFQYLLAAYCFAREKQWRARGLTEQRVQISPTRFRIPDLAIVDLDNRDQIVRKPPLLCIEILSPEDRLKRVVIRAQDFVRMGVPEVWIIDPQTRRCYTYTEPAGLHEVLGGILTTSDGRISLNIAELGE